MAPSAFRGQGHGKAACRGTLETRLQSFAVGLRAIPGRTSGPASGPARNGRHPSPADAQPPADRSARCAVMRLERTVDIGDVTLWPDRWQTSQIPAMISPMTIPTELIGETAV